MLFVILFYLVRNQSVLEIVNEAGIFLERSVWGPYWWPYKQKISKNIGLASYSGHDVNPSLPPFINFKNIL